MNYESSVKAIFVFKNNEHGFIHNVAGSQRTDLPYTFLLPEVTRKEKLRDGLRYFKTFF